jgi:hypothetical protein
MWKGHLAVLVDDKWLLDPTLDQANKKEWPHSMRVGPLAVRLEEKFWAEWGSIMVQTNGCTVRFSPHPRQIGFANAGDARPSHWKPLADRILRAVRPDEGTPILNSRKSRPTPKIQSEQRVGKCRRPQIPASEPAKFFNEINGRNKGQA